MLLLENPGVYDLGIIESYVSCIVVECGIIPVINPKFGTQQINGVRVISNSPTEIAFGIGVLHILLEHGAG